MKLTLLCLSDGDDDQQSYFLGFIRPGALHRARWMSKLLNYLKMVLLSKQINKLSKRTIIIGQQLNKLQQFTNFVVCCCIPWWLTAPVPASAPVNDLHFINTIMEYKVIESTIAAVALKATNGHLWYLTQELLPPALLSDLEEKHKENIMEVLKEHKHDSGASPRRTGAGYGKSSFPGLPKEATVDLAKFAGKDSFLFSKF